LQALEALQLEVGDHEFCQRWSAALDNQQPSEACEPT
jgi:hypothetical protein